MSSLDSVMTRNQAASIDLGTRFPSKKLTSYHSQGSLTIKIRRLLMKYSAWMDLMYRQQKSLSSEEFYQSHVNVIFMAMYTEIILGVLAGIGGISLFGMWAVR